jgi:hypothetical protein
MVLGAQFFSTGFIGELLNKGAERSDKNIRRQVAEEI